MELYHSAAITFPAGLGRMPSGSPPDAARIQDLQLRHACSEFESLLYASMLKSMRSAIPKTDLIYGGSAEDIFTAMLDEEYARLMSHNGRTQFSEALYEQLKPR